LATPPVNPERIGTLIAMEPFALALNGPERLERVLAKVLDVTSLPFRWCSK